MLPLPQWGWDTQTAQWSYIEGKAGAEIFNLGGKWPDE